MNSNWVVKEALVFSLIFIVGSSFAVAGLFPLIAMLSEIGVPLFLSVMSVVSYITGSAAAIFMAVIFATDRI